MTRLGLIACLSTVAALCAALALAQNRTMPISPLKPTYADCGRLQSVLHKEFLLPASNDVMSCQTSQLRSNVDWGRSPRCSYLDYSVYTPSGREPFDSCSPLQVSYCSIARKVRSELETCRARAAAGARDDQIGADEDGALAWFQRGNDLVDTYQSLNRTIRSPELLLLRFAQGGDASASQLLARNPTDSDREAWAKEAYRAARNGVDEAIRISRFPRPVRFIQRAALNGMELIWGDVYGELVDAEQELATFSTQSYRAPARAPEAASSAQASAVDCSVLMDMNASRQLQSSNVGQWLMLVEACQ